METIIEARGLGKRYHHKDAVYDLNLSLPAGRACAFLGRNGAGKTTTIKTLAMAFRPRLLILDEPFAGLDPRRNGMAVPSLKIGSMEQNS